MSLPVAGSRFLAISAIIIFPAGHAVCSLIPLSSSSPSLLPFPFSFVGSCLFVCTDAIANYVDIIRRGYSRFARIRRLDFKACRGTRILKLSRARRISRVVHTHARIHAFSPIIGLDIASTLIYITTRESHAADGEEGETAKPVMVIGRETR